MRKYMEKIKRIWAIALPMVIQGIVFQLQSLTDKAFLGNMDSIYISALGASQSPFIASMDTMVALASGVVIICSRLYGAKKEKQMNRYVLSNAWYSTVLTCALFAIWFFGTEGVLALFNVDQVLLEYCVPYIKICSFTAIWLGVESSISAYLQGRGETKPVMVCGLIKVLFNMVISYVLIFGKIGFPALGMEGAAIGTVVSNFISFAGLFVFCFVKNRTRFGWNYSTGRDIQFRIYQEILKISVPTALEYFLWNASNMVLISLLNGISYRATAIYSLTFGIEIILYMVYNGTGKAAMTLIGQEIGAEAYEEADGYIKGCILVNVVMISVFLVIAIFFSPQILGIFTKDRELIQMAAPFLIMTAVIMFSKSFNIIAGNGIRAHKDTKWMLYTQIIGSICTITLSYTLIQVFHIGVLGVYLTLWCDETLRAAINLKHYIGKYSSKHKKNDVTLIPVNQN
ncbi:MAG: MATE family efflux transporter [bacterium]|nr:MATE family efflux transporter [bacterium]